MSIEFLGGLKPYRANRQFADEIVQDDAVDTAEPRESGKRISFMADALSFQQQRNRRVLRPIAWLTLLTTAWLFFPRTVFAKEHVYKPVSQLAKGLTQTPDAKQLQKINQRIAAEEAKKASPTADVEPLNSSEMQGIRGRGANRNAYLAGGTMPWQRDYHDVNLCTGNLLKSFTDIQVAPGRGAGLALQRTYNSNDDRQGPFGTGWTHAYDIRMEEAGTETVVDPNTQAQMEKEIVPRTDFFGGKHKYSRDADGLYTPPAYLYDELDSRYDAELVDGVQRSLEDNQVGMDGTVKHFVPEGMDANGKPSKTRVCDYIQDRFGNTTHLDYNQTATFPDGSVKHLLTQVKDPVNRTLNFTWQNLGSSSTPAWRITSVQGPKYTVTYDYYSNAADPSSYLNLWQVHIDSAGLNRTTTYTYTSCGGEDGLLASISDALGETVSYSYTNVGYTVNGQDYPKPTGTVWVKYITESAGVDSLGNQRTNTWEIHTGNPVLNGYQAQNDLYLEYTYVLLPGTQRSIYSVRVDPQRLAVRYTRLGSGQNPPQVSFEDFDYTYDSSMNVVLMERMWGLSQQATYVTNGRLRNQNFIRTDYGPHGNVLQQGYVIDGLNPNTWAYPPTVTTYYDASKYFQKASVKDSKGNISTFDYFDRNDPIVGNRGNMKWLRGALYNVPSNPNFHKEFDYTYNQYGQKSSETNMNGVTTTYAYSDSWGNLTQVVQDPGNGHLNRTTSMNYDSVGNVLNSTDPNGSVSYFLYNNLGQPLTASFPSKPVSGTPAETVSYVYAANGRTSSVTDNRGTTSITYEAGCDRVASVSDPVTGTTSYTYAPTGERLSMTMPGGGTVSYAYTANTPLYAMSSDSADGVIRKLSRITDDQGRIVDIDMSNNGRIRTVRYNQTFSGSDLVSYMETSYLYDDDGDHYNQPNTGRPVLKKQETTWNAKDSQNNVTVRLLNRNEYTYDNNAERTSNTITTTDSSNNPISRTENYTYDELSRLRTVGYGDGENQTYSFDAMGNRTAKTDNVTGNESYSFDNANRLTTRTAGTSASVTSDANGNTLTDGSGIGSRTNTWDSQNRLVRCSKQLTSGNYWQDTAYTYGADGLRRRAQTNNRTIFTDPGGDDSGDFLGVIKSLGIGDAHARRVRRQNGAVSSLPTHYGYDGTSVVREWTEISPQVLNISATYLIGPNGPMYKRPANTADVRWYVYDGLGSVVGEVDVNGNLTCQKKHDVYGLNRGVIGTATSKHGFVGGLGHYSDDETGFIYMRARYYDPATGRFISEDPGRERQNWFTYCNNDPVNKIDEKGTSASDINNIVSQAIGAMETGGGVMTARLLLMFLQRLVGIAKIADLDAMVKQAEADANGLLAQFAPHEVLKEIHLQLKAAYESMSVKDKALGMIARIGAYQIMLALFILEDVSPDVGRAMEKIAGG